MPHYRDGQEVQLGDLAVGRGYNVKAEIAGLIGEIRPGPVCNVTVFYLDTEITPGSIAFIGHGGSADMCRAVEYGQADAFSLISRAADRRKA